MYFFEWLISACNPSSNSEGFAGFFNGCLIFSRVSMVFRVMCVLNSSMKKMYMQVSIVLPIKIVMLIAGQPRLQLFTIGMV